jgi:hypothetical protein
MTAMPVTNVPTFSASEIAQWRKEKDRLTVLLVDTQRRLGAVNQFLNAAQVLAGDEPESELEEEGSENPDEHDPSNFMGTIFKIVNESEKPLSKSDLKAALLAAGVDKERMKGPYFYVAIARLKKKNRITVHPDGTVSKGLRRI